MIRRAFAKFYKDVRYLGDDAPTRAKYDAKLDQLIAPESNQALQVDKVEDFIVKSFQQAS